MLRPFRPCLAACHLHHHKSLPHCGNKYNQLSAPTNKTICPYAISTSTQNRATLHHAAINYWTTTAWRCMVGPTNSTHPPTTLHKPIITFAPTSLLYPNCCLFPNHTITGLQRVDSLAIAVIGRFGHVQSRTRRYNCTEEIGSNWFFCAGSLKILVLCS